MDEKQIDNWPVFEKEEDRDMFFFLLIMFASDLKKESDEKETNKEE